MNETWVKIPGQEMLGQDEFVYNVTKETVVRSVQRTELTREKERLQSEIDAINADLTKISELQAKDELIS